MSESKILAKFEKSRQFLCNSYKTLSRKYADKFIAIDNGQVVAANKDLKQLLRILKRKGFSPSVVLVEYIPSKNMRQIL